MEVAASLPARAPNPVHARLEGDRPRTKQPLLHRGGGRGEETRAHPAEKRSVEGARDPRWTAYYCQYTFSQFL